MGDKKLRRRVLSLAIAAILAFGGINIGASPMVVQAEGANLVVNGDFEANWDAADWNKVNAADWPVKQENSYDNTTMYFNYYADVAQDFSISKEVAVAEAGTYTATMQIAGNATEDSGLDFTVGSQSVDLTGIDGDANGWQTFEIKDIALEADTSVTISVAGSVAAAYWFAIDNITLTKDTAEGDGTEGDGTDGDGTEDNVTEVISLWDATTLVTNGDFEASIDGATGWTVDSATNGFVKVDAYAGNNTTKLFHLENNGSAAVAFSMTQIISNLEAGTYKLVLEQDGAEMASGLSISVGEMTTVLPATTGWDTWTTVESDAFTLAKAGNVKIVISGEIAAGYWGDIDNIVLKKQDAVVVNGDFEASATEATGWTITTPGTAYGYIKTDEYATNNTTKLLHLDNSGDTAAAFSMTQTISNLEAGTYKLVLNQDGAEVASGLSVSVGGVTKVLPATTGWDTWTTVETDTFTLTEAGDVTITFSGDMAAGYWGNIDNVAISVPSVVIEADDSVVDDNTGDDNTDDDNTDDDVVEDTTAAKNVQIHVDPVEGISDDFIGGMDISSYLVLKENGVKFYDYDGNELDNQGWFDFLAECGVNYVRIRVWNDPYDAEGHGYGGGNNDLAKAIEMGQYATEAGMRVLIDFHYSDTWADPGRQLVPKAWVGKSTEEMVVAIKEFTTDSLTQLKNAGVDVGMVQVGNETTTAFIGAAVDSEAYYAYLKAGCEAVRAFDANIKIALHFTNPENGRYGNTAKNLQEAGIDYDVFASSYYPMWHGTLENLQEQLSYVRETYGKEVLVAETSWPYTTQDGDGCGNSAGSAGVDDEFYDLSVHGQAGAMRQVIEATVKAGGIGVFYWEPAWLPVNVIDWSDTEKAQELLAANEEAWHENGAGWASDYAGSYDPEVAEWGGGGDVIDNQAMFDFWGYPLQTLSIFKYAKEGIQGTVTMSVVMPASYKYVMGVDEFAMPGTVSVRYTDQNYKDCAVVWDEAQVTDALAAGVGSYTIDGTVTVDGATYDTTCTLEIQMINLLSNPELEEDNTGAWTISDAKVASIGKENVRNGTYSLRFWSDADFSFVATQEVTLDAGYYTFGGYLMGEGAGTYKYTVQNGEQTLEATAALNGWNQWNAYEVEEFCVTSDNTTITVGVAVSGGAGAWGGFDDFYLYKTGTYEAAPIPPAGDDEEDTPEEPGEDTPEEPGEDTPEEPGEDTPEEPGEDTPEEPGEDTPEEPGEDTPEEPGEDTPEEPGEDTSDDETSDEVAEDVVTDWSDVQTEVENFVAAGSTTDARTEDVNLNFISTGETKVPTNVLREIKGDNVTVAFQSGNGVAMSISGQKLNGVDLNRLQYVDLTVTKEPNVIPDEVVASKAAVAKRELSVKDTGSFGVAVDMHIHVGRENAGKIANLYRYNHTTGRLEFCGDFRITANGQSMFAVDRGGDYLVTVTNTTVNESVRYFGGNYVVQAGDTLSQIASRYHMSLSELIRRNPQLVDPDMIRVGQKLNVN